MEILLELDVDPGAGKDPFYGVAKVTSDLSLYGL